MSDVLSLVNISAAVANWPDDVRNAFIDYLDMPARSMKRLAERYAEHSTDGSAPSRATLERWSMHYGWQDIAAQVSAARMAGSRSEALEAISMATPQAVDTLKDLLQATKSLVTPTGDVLTVPDLDMRRRAAESLLDRAGLSAVNRSAVTVSGADGGPVKVLHAHLDFTDMSADELLQHMRDKALKKD